MCGRPSLVDTKEREKKRRDVERKTRASRPRQPPIQCLQPVFDVVSSERGWRVVKKVTDERNNKSALGRITGKYRDRPGLVQLFVACYYRNVELLKKIVLPVLDWSRESGLAAAAVVVVLVLL